MILSLTRDLLWSSRIKSTGEVLHLPVLTVHSIDTLKAQLADSSPTGVILDLEHPHWLEALDWIRSGKSSSPTENEQTPRELPVVVFGPHVLRDALTRAGEHGATQVLPRGRFAKELPQILKGLADG